MRRRAPREIYLKVDSIKDSILSILPQLMLLGEGDRRRLHRADPDRQVPVAPDLLEDDHPRLGDQADPDAIDDSLYHIPCPSAAGVLIEKIRAPRLGDSTASYRGYDGVDRIPISSFGQYAIQARPMIWSMSMGPNARESDEFERLSPRTYTWPSGIVSSC